MIKNDPDDKPLKEDVISEDVPPDLNGDKPLEERVAILESIAEGPPRLPDRMILLESKVDWLENVVAANKLSAGYAEDAAHENLRHKAGKEEAEKAIEHFHDPTGPYEQHQYEDMKDIRTRISDIRKGLSDVSGVIIWIVITAALVLAIVMNIGYKVIFG